MRSFGAAADAWITAGNPVGARLLVWIAARNRTTGATETLGLWDEVFDQDFVIGGVTRTYRAGGSVLEVENVTAEAGLSPRTHQISLSPLTAEVEQAIRGYDARLAPVEVHRVLLDPSNGQALSPPHPYLIGTVDHVSLPTAETMDAVCTVSVVSSARELTRGEQLYWSDATQSRRAGDRILRHAAVAGRIPVFWGEARK